MLSFVERYRRAFTLCTEYFETVVSRRAPNFPMLNKNVSVISNVIYTQMSRCTLQAIKKSSESCYVVSQCTSHYHTGNYDVNFGATLNRDATRNALCIARVLEDRPQLLQVVGTKSTA